VFVPLASPRAAAAEAMQAVRSERSVEKPEGRPYMLPIVHGTACAGEWRFLRKSCRILP
jgi:hypothetical protein